MNISKMYKPTKTEWAWAMYDFANSAYAFIVLTIFFPLFFVDYIVAGKQTTFWWGLALASSILLVGLISPILGAYTDKKAKRKSYFVLFSICSVIGTMMLSFTANVPWFAGILIFILVNTTFGISRSLYDSFITVVPHEKNVSTTLSGFSWSMGYIGGPLCLLIAWIFMGEKLPSDLSDYKTLFLVTGLFFFFFSLWPYHSLPRDSKHSADDKGMKAFKTVWQTLYLWRTMKHIFVFLIAIYFIMDGLTTIIFFFSLFAKINLEFSTEQIVGILLVVQVVGIFTTVFISWLAEKHGELKLLIFCSILWLFITILIFFSFNYTTFLIIAILSGIVIGSTPAIARGYFGKIVPVEKRAEFFGFSTFASRIATIIGPLLFGFAASIWDMRIAILTIIPFFLTGIIILIYLKNNLSRW